MRDAQPVGEAATVTVTLNGSYGGRVGGREGCQSWMWMLGKGSGERREVGESCTIDSSVLLCFYFPTSNMFGILQVP